MPKITQEISKNGKTVFTKKVNSPTDKGRGAMPHPSKAHKKEKGKGSYDRKNAFKEEGEEDEQSCWKGYKKKGTKKKGGKIVKNCVKESTDLSKFIEAIMTSDHAEAHKQLKNAINSKIQKRIAQEIDNPLF